MLGLAQLCPTLCDPMDCSPPGSSVHGDPSGKNTGVGCHSLLQGIFPTQGLNPGLPHYREVLYCLNNQGSPNNWISHTHEAQEMELCLIIRIWFNTHDGSTLKIKQSTTQEDSSFWAMFFSQGFRVIQYDSVGELYLSNVKVFCFLFSD